MGLAWAQTSLAVAYLQGDGIEKSVPETIQWFERAANQDFAPAQYHLAGLYAQGHAGNDKQALAPQIMRRSADQGYEKAKLVMKRWDPACGIGEGQSWALCRGRPGRLPRQIRSPVCDCVAVAVSMPA